jgi:glycine/D-amino acid oxidase-like deaminating enzyme
LKVVILGYHTNVSVTYDVVVVGAGVFGAWTAYHLKRSGARVLLIDQHGPGNSRASSGGETRIIRMSYGASEIYTRSSMLSLELWKGLCPFLFHKTGVLVTAAPSDPYLIDTREVLSRCGVPHERLSATALHKRFPQVSLDHDTEGIWEPDSGILMARRAVQAVVEASGADYEIRTGTKNIRAGTVVYACGPWLPKLFPEILKGRIRPTRQEVFFFGTPPEYKSMPTWIAFREGVYSIPALDGRGFKIAIDSHGPAFDPETGDREITQAALSKTRAILRKRFPALARAPLVESRVCQYENTSNGDFLIDRHPHRENVWLVGGGSGHGFKHGPWVGEYVASQIAGTAPAEPRFSLASKKTTRQRSVY